MPLSRAQRRDLRAFSGAYITRSTDCEESPTKLGVRIWGTIANRLFYELETECVGRTGR